MSKDRRDGKYIKPVDGIHKIFPYICDKRCDSEVHIYKTLDITKLLVYIDKENKNIDDKRKQITVFHTIITMFSKILYIRPTLNRFIQGKRYYQRNNVSMAFVAKNKFSDEAEERLIILDIKEDMNLKDISNDILNNVSKVRSEGTNNIDKLLNKVTVMPRWLLSIFIKIVKLLDFYGKTPKSLMDGDINYASVLLSNLGSIKCDAIYHHLNNYGTNSIIVTIGEIKREKNKSTITLGLTCDERIADGFYFAKSLKILDYLVDNPEVLEDAVNSKIDYEI